VYARVARFEGGEADAIRSNVAAIKEAAEAGPPEGVKSTGFTFLADPERGAVIAIGFFETEADLEESEPVLDAMSPPAGAMGNRVSVERYEVGFEVRI
jgi:hypothetical protein